MQFNAVVLVVARFLHNLLLLRVWSLIDLNLLAVEVESGEAYDEFFIHLIAFESGVLEHFHGHLILA